MSSSSSEFDIVIIGGGMVGASFAIGAAQQGKRVAIIEHQAPTEFDPKQCVDLRLSAISPASVALLEQLNVWQALIPERVCPYRHLTTWEHSQHRVSFAADQLNLDILGYMIENKHLQFVLWQQLEAHPLVDCIIADPLEKLATLPPAQQGHLLTLQSQRTLSARMVVGADGAHSQLRGLLGIGTTEWDYQQSCLLISIDGQSSQKDETWQWFTTDGPRAFLPFVGTQAVLAWYDSPERTLARQQLPSADLARAILQHYPSQLGPVKVLQRQSFPLTRRHAQQYYHQHAVLVGDAAHTINPLAGQGVNLGFKDIKCLLDLIEQRGEHWAEQSTLAKYQQLRRPDNLLMQTAMDGLYIGFRSQNPLLRWSRNRIFSVVERLPMLKHTALKYALGLGGK